MCLGLFTRSLDVGKHGSATKMDGLGFLSCARMGNKIPGTGFYWFAVRRISLSGLQVAWIDRLIDRRIVTASERKCEVSSPVPFRQINQATCTAIMPTTANWYGASGSV
jgi:hypothetical protein